MKFNAVPAGCTLKHNVVTGGGSFFVLRLKFTVLCFQLNTDALIHTHFLRAVQICPAPNDPVCFTSAASDCRASALRGVTDKLGQREVDAVGRQRTSGEHGGTVVARAARLGGLLDRGAVQPRVHVRVTGTEDAWCKNHASNVVGVQR